MSELRNQIQAAVADGRLTDGLVDICEAARILGKQPGTLYQWRSKGLGPRSYKVGGSVRYDPADLRAYLLGHVSEPAA